MVKFLRRQNDILITASVCPNWYEPFIFRGTRNNSSNVIATAAATVNFDHVFVGGVVLLVSTPTVVSLLHFLQITIVCAVGCGEPIVAGERGGIVVLAMQPHFLFHR